MSPLAQHYLRWAVLCGSLTTFMSCRHSPAPIRINSGGPAYLDTRQQKWNEDGYYTGGVQFVTKHPVENTNASELYQSARYGNSFRYSIPVPNGRTTVRLMFAEIYFNAPGARVFNVTINDVPVLTKFDPYAKAAGANRAIDREFTVDVKDGRVKIQFTPIAQDPLVNAIELSPGRG